MNDTSMFSVQTFNGTHYLCVELEPGIVPDAISVRMLQEDRPPFFLELQEKEQNNRVRLRYPWINGMALAYRAGRNVGTVRMTKEEYVKLALSLLTPFIKCREWFLDYHCICIDPQYILYNQRLGMYQFVYIPTASMSNADDEIVQLFESVLNYIDIPDDQSFQISILHKFREDKPTLRDLYEIFITEQEKIEKGFASAVASNKDKVSTLPVRGNPPVLQEPAEPVQPDQASGSQAAKTPVWERLGVKPAKESVPPSSAAHPNAPLDTNVMDTDPNEALMAELLGDEKKKKGFSWSWGKKKDAEPKPNKYAETISSKEPKKQPATPERSVPSMQTPVPADVSTVPSIPSIPSVPPQATVFEDRCMTMIGELPRKEPHLELIRDGSVEDSVPREISLSFSQPYLTVGRKSRDMQAPEIAFPENCKGMSRQHARIERNGEQIYLIDLGSKNGTMVDENTLVPNMKYLLSEGQIVTFVKTAPIRYRVCLL